MKVSALCFALFLAVLLSACSGGKFQGTIVFQSSRDGNFEIYTMDAEGHNIHRLTNSPSNDVTPCWSPDGSHIAFASDRDGNWEIYTMLADGSQPTRLTNGPGANTTPWWTPDGKKILFVSSRDAINGELYLMNPDGSDPVRVTNDSTVKDTPVMTPDGKEVLFTVNTKGRYRIASYSMDSKVFQFLTPPDYNSAHPSISPDGAAFLFASDMDGTSEIFSMPLAGGTATKITGGTGGATTPTWTNDPEQVLISRKGGICLLALKTKKEMILTYRGDSAPQWQSR